MRLYFASLYYKAERVTGANKRFDEVGKRLLAHFKHEFFCVVCDGERPDWCPEKNCLYIGQYKSKLGRIKSCLEYSYKLMTLPQGVLINDFMPAPFVLGRHRVYQLIHDLRSFNSFSRGGLGYFTSMFQKWQLSQAYRVITVSHFSAGEISSLCKIDAESIIVSYNGLNYSPLTQTERDIDLIYVATFEERKNHSALVAALSAIEDRLNVLFIGRDLGTKNLIEQESERCTQHNIQFVESVSEGELKAYYLRSKLFCFPSLYEGFGMPLIEAAQLGASVCCSDIPVFQEILGEFGVYFDPHSAESIRGAVQAELQRRSFDAVPIEVAEYVNSKFLWDNISSHLIGEIDK